MDEHLALAVADRFGDPTEALVGFARALGAAGVSVGSERTATFLAAGAALKPDRTDALYWAGRLALTSCFDDLAIYDAVFGNYFSIDDPELRRLAPAAPLPPQRAPFSDDDPEGSGDEDTEDAAVVTAKASSTEVLRHRDVASLSEAERRELAKLIQLLRPGLPERRSRRRRPHAHGPIDPHRTVRHMLAAWGEPAIPVQHRSRPRPRRVVLLLDVSGSMSPYADTLLRFAHAVARYRPNTSEVFTLGTRLTRITAAMTLREPDAALQAAAHTIADYSGGTRLGETLKAFIDRWGRRGTARGSVVVIFSDGWERDYPDQLALQVATLRRIAHQLIWVNPHKGSVGYEPVQSGIVAILPHVDHFVAGHSLAALEELLTIMRRA